MGNTFILAGLILILVGILANFFGKIGIPALPGDILFRNEHTTVYIPIVSSIILSILITIILNVFK